VRGEQVVEELVAVLLKAADLWEEGKCDGGRAAARVRRCGRLCEGLLAQREGYRL
jgi:hypothetical protein